jgi:hypothetical protein
MPTTRPTPTIPPAGAIVPPAEALWRLGVALTPAGLQALLGRTPGAQADGGVVLAGFDGGPCTFALPPVEVVATVPAH